MRFLLLALVLLLPLSAHARQGEWGSSNGGEFLRDQNNPWFLKNVTEVKYCLRIDPAGFSSSPAKAAELTELALHYWKGQLQPRDPGYGLGQQKFTPSAGGCTGHEDLTLLFGYGALDEAQRKMFSDKDEDPQDYVGIAIRTDYDKETLRGKGFLFIASDQGDYIYNRGQGINRKLWNHDGLLFRILQHELGHVFGIAHTEDGFMAHDFPEFMVRNFKDYRVVRFTPFFEPISSFDTCGGTRDNDPCIRGETKDLWKTIRLSSQNRSEEEKSLGTVMNGRRHSTRHRFPLRIFLTKEQKLFPPQPARPWLQGPARSTFKVTGTLETPEGEKKPILLDLRPDSVELFFDAGKGFGPR